MATGRGRLAEIESSFCVGCIVILSEFVGVQKRHVRSATNTCARGCVITTQTGRFLFMACLQVIKFTTATYGAIPRTGCTAVCLRQCSRIIIPLNPSNPKSSTKKGGPPEVFAEGTRPPKQKFQLSHPTERMRPLRPSSHGHVIIHDKNNSSPCWFT